MIEKETSKAHHVIEMLENMEKTMKSHVIGMLILI